MMALNGGGLVWYRSSSSRAQHQALLSTNTLLMVSALTKWIGHLHSKVISVSTQGPRKCYTEVRYIRTGVLKTEGWLCCSSSKN